MAEIQDLQPDFGIELTDSVLLSFKSNVESVAKGERLFCQFGNEQ